ncbi:MAG: cytochrome c4, partial [Bradyrhizobiaceae bacterium]
AACVDCHGHAGVGTPRAPALAGQYADYVSRQLSLWKTGRRHDPDDVMGRIARRMTEADIRAAASYFAALPGESAVSE